jgi:ABC-type transport system substrate-binding protein
MQLSSFADIRVLDPANVADGLVPEILEPLFAGLVDFDEKGGIALDLAERLDLLDDAKRYRFTLRQGARFHDGTEVTADDVVRAARRALGPGAPNPYSSYFASLHGYEAYSQGKSTELGVEARGRYVVDYVLDERDASFLPALALQVLRPVCPSAGQVYKDGWLPCGAGPFKLPEGNWLHGREVRLVRHEAYFRPGLPHLDGITWTFHVNVKTEFFKFLRGDVAMLRDFLAPDLLRLRADPRWAPFGAYEAEKQLGAESMNTELPPFDNVEVRRAVASAIRHDHVRLVQPQNLLESDGPLPKSMGAFDPCQRYDYEAALDHMKRAGYAFDPATGRGGYPHPISYVTYRQGLQDQTIQVIAQDLAKIGLDVKVRVVNYPSYMALVQRRHQVQMGPYGWAMDFPEPSSILTPLFHSRSINDEDSNNTSFYKSRVVDEALDAAKKESDATARHADYARALSAICHDAPMAFTSFYRWYDARQPWVRGYVPNPVWSHHVSFTWIDRSPSAWAERTVLSPVFSVGAMMRR